MLRQYTSSLLVCPYSVVHVQNTCTDVYLILFIIELQDEKPLSPTPYTVSDSCPESAKHKCELSTTVHNCLHSFMLHPVVSMPSLPVGADETKGYTAEMAGQSSSQAESASQREDPKELRNLMNDPEIRKLDAHWKELGIQLGIEIHILDKLDTDRRNISESDDCMREMLKTFLKIEANPTWETVDKAVAAVNNILGRVSKRGKIAEKETTTKEAIKNLLDISEEWKKVDEDITEEQKRLADKLEKVTAEFNEKQSAEEMKVKMINEMVQELRDDLENSSSCEEELGNKRNELLKAEIQLSKLLASGHCKIQRHKEHLASILCDSEEWKKKVADRTEAMDKLLTGLEILDVDTKRIAVLKQQCRELIDKCEESIISCNTALKESVGMLKDSKVEIELVTRGLSNIINAINHSVNKLQSDISLIDENIKTLESEIKDLRKERELFNVQESSEYLHGIYSSRSLKFSELLQESSEYSSPSKGAGTAVHGRYSSDAARGLALTFSKLPHGVTSLDQESSEYSSPSKGAGTAVHGRYSSDAARALSVALITSLDQESSEYSSPSKGAGTAVHRRYSSDAARAYFVDLERARSEEARSEREWQIQKKKRTERERQKNRNKLIEKKEMQQQQLDKKRTQLHLWEGTHQRAEQQLAALKELNVL